MTRTDDDFLARLQATFRDEAEEHLRSLAAGLLEFEHADEDARRAEILAAVFREAHSLKGAARAVNLGQIESICQSLEGVFAAWKRRAVPAAPALLDPLHAALSTVERLLPSNGGAAPAGETEMTGLLGRLAEVEAATPADQHAEPASPAPPHIAPPPATAPPESRDSSATAAAAAAAAGTASVPHATSETLRISTAKLDALLLQAEELLAVKLTADQRAEDLRALVEVLQAWEKEWAKVSPEFHALRQMAARGDGAARPGRVDGAAARLVEFLDWNLGHARSVRDRVAALAKSAEHDRRAAAAMVDSLLGGSKKLLMLPFATLFELFPKLVRDLSRAEGKPADLVVRGAEIEIDKRILEEMKDPLIHLLRNAVDHGLELPNERAARGKPARGTITLSVAQVDGNKVEILVADDGGGIDLARVRQAAVRRGMITADEARRLDEAAAMGLIFRPEFSTSATVTEISGRGLGMAIVKERAERLGGRVGVRTQGGRGTRISVLIPLTLATFRGVLVRVAEQVFVLPLAGVERVARVRAEEIRTVENRPTIRVDDRVVALAELEAVLGLTRPAATAGPAAALVPVVVLGAGDRRIAFRVDAVLNEQEVLVKPLGRPLSRVRNIAGATVLGAGKPVPILNVADLLKSAVNAPGRDACRTVASPAPATGAEAAPRQQSILVAEDSITARMLLKNILESAGYAVRTAVDGVDAWAALSTGQFDLLVSDVEMPRMDGFDLTARVRADGRLADLPVVLVTALESREHRERGADAGANAYLVKSSFDQSNLLEAIQRLL
jgi:two-component system chemotaxis sensor kinase CheA